MCTYLSKRGSTYYFRRPVPKDLLEAFHPRTEWMVSLRTKDRETAKAELPAWAAQTNREIRQARMLLPSAERESAPAPPPKPPLTPEQQAWEAAAWEHEQSQATHDAAGNQARSSAADHNASRNKYTSHQAVTKGKWPFRAFQVWLLEKSRRLQDGGFIVEYYFNDNSRASVRLRVERDEKIGEIVVWDDGMVSESIVDLENSEFIYDRNGVILSNNWENDFKEFFNIISNQY